jgi:hypothetical protein
MGRAALTLFFAEKTRAETGVNCLGPGLTSVIPLSRVVFLCSGGDEPTELNAHQVEAGCVQSTCTAQKEQSMVYLRLIWLICIAVEKVAILGERERRRELVTFCGIQIGQSLFEGYGLERRDVGSARTFAGA